MSLRKFLFWAHLAAGLAAGVLVLNAALTGMIIAFEGQILDAVERGVRRVPEPPPAPGPLNPDAVAAAAAATAPGKAVTALTFSSDPAASAAVQLGREGTVYVDPYAVKVLGRGSKVHDALHAVEDWHRWLWSRKTGRPLTGAACLFFLCLMLSGLYLWWPAKTYRFGPGLTGKARDWNWHNVIGFWCAPFILSTTLTGTVMAYGWANDLLFRLAGTEPPPRPPAGARPGGEDRTPPPPLPPLGALWSEAAKTVPAWESITLRMPRKEGDSVTVFVVEPSGVGPPRRSQLTLDAQTAQVVKAELYKDQTGGRRARTWARYLHTGEVFGWPGQLAAFLAAFGATFLVWTGFALSWRRFFRPRV
jgi:uncharacterized iron-regulated membrane protein